MKRARPLFIAAMPFAAASAAWVLTGSIIAALCAGAPLAAVVLGICLRERRGHPRAFGPLPEDWQSPAHEMVTLHPVEGDGWVRALEGYHLHDALERDYRRSGEKKR